MRVCIYSRLCFSELRWYFSVFLLDLLVLFVFLISVACFF
jgi:hypothetical protein